jgi:hypothetical protein
MLVGRGKQPTTTTTAKYRGLSATAAKAPPSVEMTCGCGDALFRSRLRAVVALRSERFFLLRTEYFLSATVVVTFSFGSALRPYAIGTLLRFEAGFPLQGWMPVKNMCMATSSFCFGW